MVRAWYKNVWSAVSTHPVRWHAREHHGQNAGTDCLIWQTKNMRTDLQENSMTQCSFTLTYKRTCWLNAVLVWLIRELHNSTQFHSAYKRTSWLCAGLFSSDDNCTIQRNFACWISNTFCLQEIVPWVSWNGRWASERRWQQSGFRTNSNAGSQTTWVFIIVCNVSIRSRINN